MPPPLPPDRPTFFGSTADRRERSRGFNSFQLTWIGPTDATAFDMVFNGVMHSNVSPGVFVPGLTPNSPQSAAVRARNAADEASDFSPPLDSFTRPPTPQRPRFVPGQEDARGPNSFTVTWPAIAGIPVYDAKLDGATLLLGDPANFPAGDPNPVFTVGDLPPNTRHSVQIRARDDARGGPSFFSPSRTDFTRPPTPDLPGLVGDGESSRDSGRLQITWEFVEGQAQFDYAYDLEIDDAENVHFPQRLVLPNRAPGANLDQLDTPSRVLQTNVRYVARVRSRNKLNDRGRASLFSLPFSTATRPPQPTEFHRGPFGTPLTGPVFLYAVIPPFHLIEEGHVVLLRRLLDGEFTPILQHAASSIPQFADAFAPDDVRKDYFVELRVLLPHFGENTSRPSQTETVVDNFRAVASLVARDVGPVVGSRLARLSIYERITSNNATRRR